VYLREKVKMHTLKPGMPKATVKVHLDAVITAHAELTPRFASAIDLPQLLLDCVPESIGMDAAGSYKDRLSVELDEHHAYYGEDKYTIDQLRDGIAVRVSSATKARHVIMERGEEAATAMAVNARNPNDDDGARAKRFDGKRVKGTAGRPIQGRGTPAGNGRPQLEGTWFCFIKSEEAGDIFCHSNDIATGTLSEGCEVDFKIAYDKRKGKDKAADVRVRASTAAVAEEGETEYDASGLHY
jgi:cold shock CspA family protein